MTSTSRVKFLCLQAVVLEGKYWKRRLQSVAAEYMKWRRFYKSLMSKRNGQAPGLLIKSEVRIKYFGVLSSDMAEVTWMDNLNQCLESLNDM